MPDELVELAASGVRISAAQEAVLSSAVYRIARQIRQARLAWQATHGPLDLGD